METVYLLLGSNLGDRQAHLRMCLTRLPAIGKVVAASSVYETKAWGKQDQPDFLNQVVSVETTLSPKKTLILILEIEISLGRARQEQWGSRIIDIDILLFGSQIIDTEKLKVPHPHLPERRFALIPLAEIASDFLHPMLNKSIQTLLVNCADPLEVKKFQLTDTDYRG
jgi:2-amino-4-hydroxy-6-hydroxymethyldihydropteridine diphosphokinase